VLTKVAAHDAVPRWAVLSVELLLDERCNILLDVELVQALHRAQQFQLSKLISKMKNRIARADPSHAKAWQLVARLPAPMPPILRTPTEHAMALTVGDMEAL